MGFSVAKTDADIYTAAWQMIDIYSQYHFLFIYLFILHLL